MCKLRQIIRYALLSIVATGSLLLMQSCLKEDLSYCEVDEDFLLYIKVVDVVTGEEITNSELLGETNLYIFNNNQRLIKSYNISAEQIVNKEPIIINGYNPMNMSALAWANFGDKLQITEATEESTEKDEIVSLLPHPDKKDYDISPNDFYFGFRKLAFNKDITRTTDEVVLTQKNAKLHIVVKGLRDHNANNYYLNMINKFNGYNFKGDPIKNLSIIEGKGIFNIENQLITPEPYLMIHSESPDKNNEAESTTIQLLQKEATSGDKIIAETNRDNNGKYITLSSGKTTNVLIEFNDIGQLSVHIRVTPWDEIYQWADY